MKEFTWRKAFMSTKCIQCFLMVFMVKDGAWADHLWTKNELGRQKNMFIVRLNSTHCLAFTETQSLTSSVDGC